MFLKVLARHRCWKIVNQDFGDPSIDINRINHEDLGHILSCGWINFRLVYETDNIHGSSHFARLMRILWMIWQTLLEHTEIALFWKIFANQLDYVKISITADKRHWWFEVESHSLDWQVWAAMENLKVIHVIIPVFSDINITMTFNNCVDWSVKRSSRLHHDNRSILGKAA